MNDLAKLKVCAQLAFLSDIMYLGLDFGLVIVSFTALYQTTRYVVSG